MTKQKKFKKRVRARMEKTGERYTEAQAELDKHTPDYSVEATAQRILEARMSPSDERGSLLKEVRGFHEYHRWTDTEWGKKTDSSLLFSELLETVRPLDVTTAAEMLARIRNTLDAWLHGQMPSGSGVLEPTRSVAKTHGLPLEREVRILSGVAPESDRLLGVPAEDDEWFTSEGILPDADLVDLWEQAPDVSHVFFGGERPLDQTTAENLARQFRRMADQAERMIGQTRLPGTHLKEAIPRPPMATEQIQIGDITYPAVHGGAADELIRYAQEIARLREKLAEAGIDPDA